MNIQELLRLASTQEQDTFARDIVVPLLHGQRRVAIRVAGIISHLQVATTAAGWKVGTSHDRRIFVARAEADVWQREQYLSLFPALRLILLEPTAHGSWLATPWNHDAAMRRFQIPALLQVHLVDGMLPFDRIVARVAGHIVWFDDTDRRADPAVAASMRQVLGAGGTLDVRGMSSSERFAWYTHSAAHAVELQRNAEQEAALVAHQSEVTRLAAQEEMQRQQTQRQSRSEQSIRAHLQTAGAQLAGYQINTDGSVRVTWLSQGQEHTAVLGQDMSVVAAGICVSGHDRVFDLATLVGVVDQAPSFAKARHYAVDASDWEDED